MPIIDITLLAVVWLFNTAFAGKKTYFLITRITSVWFLLFTSMK